MTASCASVCANCGMRNPSGDDQKDTAARRSRATRRQESEFQVLVVWTLLAGGFWEPFLFCLGFLASRLVRFCSLFATTASLQVSSGNYAAGARQCNRQIKAVAYSRKSSKNSIT